MSVLTRVVRADLEHLRSLSRLLLMVLVRVYQLILSPLFAGSCRYYPSCSAYGLEALRVHGALRGTWLTVLRLSRCHPWNPGGVDEVPPAGGRRSDRTFDRETRAASARAA